MTLLYKTGSEAYLFMDDGTTDAELAIKTFDTSTLTSNVAVSSRNSIFHKDGSGDYQISCVRDNAVSVGTHWYVANLASEVIDIVEGGGVQISYLTGSAVSTGNLELAQGGWAKIFKSASNTYTVWGSGLNTKVSQDANYGAVNSACDIVFSGSATAVLTNVSLAGSIAIFQGVAGSISSLQGVRQGTGAIASSFTGSGTLSQDTSLADGGTIYFVDFTNGTDAGAGNTWATRWKTISYLEANLPTSATAVYFLEGGTTTESWTLPTTHGGSASDPFIAGACYRSGSSTFRRETSSYSNMPLFDGETPNPTTLTYGAEILIQDVDDVRIENLRIDNTKARALTIRRNSGANNVERFDNPIDNIYVYNCHFETIGTYAIIATFVTNLTIDHCFASDTGRVAQVTGQNIPAVGVQGSKYVKVINNDFIFNKGENFDILYASKDFYIANNWIVAGTAVTCYIDSAWSGVIHRNVFMGLPASECTHLNHPQATESYSSGARGEALAVEFEQNSWNSSWVQSTDQPHDILILHNLLIGTTDGYRISAGSLVEVVPNWDSIDVVGNLMAGNVDQVQRSSLSTSSYTNNVYQSNIHLNGDTSGAENVGSSTGQGLDADYNYWTDSTPTGNFSGTNDVTSGLLVTKTTGFYDITFQLSSPSDARGWGEIRTTGELLDVSELRPQPGSTTIGAGPAQSIISLPTGVTVVTLPELLKDFDGKALSDPLDIGPFSNAEAPSGALVGASAVAFSASATMNLSGFAPGIGAASLAFTASGTVTDGYAGDATITYVDAVQTATSSSSRTWSCDIPSGAVADDIAFIVGTEIAGGNDITVPSGWTKIGNTLTPGTGDGDSSNVLLWKKLSSADITAGSFTFTNFWDTASTGSITMICYQNQNDTPINTNNDAEGYVFGPGGTITGPSITPTVDNCMVVQFIACDVTSGTYAAAPGNSGTERVDTQDIYLRQWIYVQDKLQTTAAALALEADIDQEDHYARWQVAIAPAPA